MIYFLGGPPRVGKSIIADQIRRETSINVISTDSIGAALEKILTPENVPDLFVFQKYNELPLVEKANLLLKDPAKHIDNIKRESHVIWQALEAFVRKEYEEHRDVLIEGVAVLPHLVSRIEDIPYGVVFIGNQGKNHKENIKKSIKSNKHDWMNNASDQYIEACAIFVNQMSKYVERESKNFSFEYIEMSKMPFVKVSAKIIKSLRISN
jgi:2-phosphoglycerate kinase